MLITYYLTVLIVVFIFNAVADLVMSIPQYFELLSFPLSEFEINSRFQLMLLFHSH